jgi:hypothetical protein
MLLQRSREALAMIDMMSLALEAALSAESLGRELEGPVWLADPRKLNA